MGVVLPTTSLGCAPHGDWLHIRKPGPVCAKRQGFKLFPDLDFGCKKRGFWIQATVQSKGNPALSEVGLIKIWYPMTLHLTLAH